MLRLCSRGLIPSMHKEELFGRYMHMPLCKPDPPTFVPCGCPRLTRRSSHHDFPAPSPSRLLARLGSVGALRRALERMSRPQHRQRVLDLSLLRWSRILLLTRFPCSHSSATPVFASLLPTTPMTKDTRLHGMVQPDWTSGLVYHQA